MGGQIEFVREKTKRTKKANQKVIQVPLTDFAKEFIEKYAAKDKSQYVLPIINDEMSEEEKSEYTDAEDFIQMDCSRWWADSFPDLEFDLKKNLIQRFRLTVALCMSSNTYSSDKIKESIESSWEDYL